MVPARSVEGLTLDARLAGEEARSIQLEWTLTNGSPHPFVVLRYLYRAFDRQGLLLPEPNLAYVSVGEDGIIHLSKKVIPVPAKGINVITPFVPLGVDLPPGGQMTETIRVRVPITWWNPYDELIQMTTGYPAMQEVQAKALSFHLGVSSMAPQATPPTRVETSLGALVYPRYQAALDTQIVLDAPLVPWTGEAYR
jgi:hypothetical protein